MQIFYPLVYIPAHIYCGYENILAYNARAYKLTLYVCAYPINSIVHSVKTISGRAYRALLITLCTVYRLSAGAHCTSRVYISHAISQSETGNR